MFTQPPLQPTKVERGPGERPVRPRQHGLLRVLRRSRCVCSLTSSVPSRPPASWRAACGAGSPWAAWSCVSPACVAGVGAWCPSFQEGA